MTCPDCGARNTADAPWCTQCLRPLGPGSTEASPTPEEATTADAPRAVGRTQAGPRADRPVRTVDGEVQWRCGACGTWSPIEVHACPACGTDLAAGMGGRSAAALADRVGRTRQLLWVVAALLGLVVVLGIVLLVTAT